MPAIDLKPHPARPPGSVTAMRFSWRVQPFWLTLRWRIENAGDVAVPPFAGRKRRDGLWRTTCFELFLMRGDNAYSEFNFSPSEAWASYDFTGYREGMSDRPVEPAPTSTWRVGGRTAIFDAAVPLAALPPLPTVMAPTAVIEEHTGATSYWAAAHPPRQPDFHDRACFAAILAAPDSP